MSDSAEILASMNDLLMQILVRIPGKPLMGFKLVSKKWKCLISSPEFSYLRNPFPNPAVGLICPGRMRRGELEYIRLDGKVLVDGPPKMLQFPDDPFVSWIQQSCNGLLLCCNSEDNPEPCGGFVRVGSWSPTRRCRCYIYNPTTNCFTKLPTPGIVHGVSKIVYGIGLAFDQTNLNPYKVVCVRESELGRALFQIEIYSPESGVWAVSGEPFGATANFDYGVYWNKSIHWISYRPRELVYFNVEEEKFAKVVLPDEEAAPVPARQGRRIVLWESCDHLNMIEKYESEAMFNVYEMKRDYSSWVVKYRVDLTEVVSAFYPTPAAPRRIQRTTVMSLVWGMEGPYLVLHLSPKVVKFNLETNMFEEICDLDDSGLESRSRCVHHIDSVACV